MSKQEVLLVKDVLKLGSMGDIVKVAHGYARNYLFTHLLAIPASAAGVSGAAPISFFRSPSNRWQLRKSLVLSNSGLTGQLGEASTWWAGNSVLLFPDALVSLAMLILKPSLISSIAHFMLGY